MKKLFFLFLPLVAAFCSCNHQLQHHQLSLGADSTEMLTVPRVDFGPDSTDNPDGTLALQDELKYYLDRHNVQDEGYEMVAAFAQQPNHQPLLPDLSRLQVPHMCRWDGISRHGIGICIDSLQRIIIGTYEADTLVSGTRIDSLGLYQGDFAHGVANGHGSYLADGGLYYQGQWVNDLRDGFGFSAAPFTHVRVGQWQRNMYLGERLQYTSERIYGIDISRYQHGKGRKTYSIQWDQLRISYLGAKHQKNANGAVDYPVSFIFIKSTESTRIRNPFYAQDYRQARRRGIPIGAYHFFSTKTSGAAQAQFFLKNTQFRRGDLPPVLDCEPTPSQVDKMGGAQNLFRNMRSFLNTVERQVGVKPILYISQSFINRYLGQAPDLKHNYPVWIARYGEYKPDVKLAVWQLSPNGRVRGIRGEVDINVFNGYRTQFDNFLETATIR